MKAGTQIYVVTRKIRHITRYTSDPDNAKIARYASVPEAVEFIFYNCIDENTIETRNFITTIKRNRLETNLTILRPKVTVEVVRFHSKSLC